jgi:hypothetical protein
MTHVCLNVATSSYFDGTVPTRKLIDSGDLVVLPWRIVVMSRENCDFKSEPEGKFPIGAALGMLPTDWRIGAAFSSQTSWDSLELTLDDKLFRATRGTPPHNGPAHAYYAPSATGAFGIYCGWAGTAPALSDVDGATFNADSTTFWQRCFVTDFSVYGGVTFEWNWSGTPSAAAIIAAAAASAQKVYMEVTVTGGTLQLFACKDGGVDPIFLRDIAPGDGPFLIAAPLWSLCFKRKAGHTPKLVRLRQFVKGVDITGFRYVLPSTIFPGPAQVSITATPNLNLTTSYPFSLSVTYSTSTGIGTGTLAGPFTTDAEGYYNRHLDVTGFNGQRVIPAGGWSLNVELPENAFWGTRAAYGEWTKPWVDDITGTGVRGLRTLDWSTRGVQNGYHHCRIPVSMIPASGQPFSAGLSPETVIDLHKKIGAGFCWNIFPYALGADYKARWVSRAINARGSSDIWIGPEVGNEVWHYKFGVAVIANQEGPDGLAGWYSEQLHDFVDALDLEVPNWRYQKVMIMTAWQTDINEATLSAIFDRKRGGVSLLKRVAQVSGCAIAPYWGGGVGGEQYNLFYQDVLDACIAQGVSLTNRPGITTVMHNLMVTSRAASLSAAAAHVQLLRDFCIARGEAFNAIRPTAYEYNQHFQDSIRDVTYQSVTSSINSAQWDDLREAIHAYRRGAQEAELTRLHTLDLAALGYEVIAFYNGPCGWYDESKKGEVNWGLKQYQSSPASPKYLKLDEANATIDTANTAEAAAIAAKTPRKLRRGVRR